MMAKWIGEGYKFICSNCGEYAEHRSDFCPGCGEPMISEEHHRYVAHIHLNFDRTFDAVIDAEEYVRNMEREATRDGVDEYDCLCSCSVKDQTYYA